MNVKEISFTRLVLMLGALTMQSQAAIRYVNVANTTPSAPYTSWATAATSIQPAVNAAVNGDTVRIASGTYSLSSEISVTKNITVEGVNGAANTIVDGNNSVRCFNLGGSACLISGLTITKGYSSSGAAGGIYCANTTPVVANCIIDSNRAATSGGGMYGGTANDCTFVRNFGNSSGGGMDNGIANRCVFDRNQTSYDGGGTYGSTANSCTFIDNSASRFGGGMYGGTADHCTIRDNYSGQSGGGMASGTANYCTFFDNRAVIDGGGLAFSTANYCTISRNRASGSGGGLRAGTDNNCTISWNRSEASFGGGGGMYEGTANNCTLVGNTAYAGGGGMLNGTARNSIVWYNTATTHSNLASTTATYTCTEGSYAGLGNITTEPLFISRFSNNFRLLPESPGINAGKNTFVVGATDLDGRQRIINNTVDMGAYEYLPTTQYVDAGGSHAYPFSSWATAATNIQAAIDATFNGHTVYVTNGTYALSSEIAVTTAILVESVNGPEVTLIDGNYTVRCFNLGTSACVISGFTIQNGYPGEFENGGGILCSSTTPVVTNCTITSNDGNLGGGMYKGTANNCRIIGNYGYNSGGLQSVHANGCFISGNNAIVGGGVVGGVLNDCTITNNSADSYGGGMYGGTANRCTITGNYSGNRGGGLDNGVANNCLIINNTAYNNGGGVYESTANNCTIRGNSAYEYGGGAYESSLKNSIVWYNSAINGSDIWLTDPEYSIGSSSYTCSPDVTHNQNGNTTATPLFIDTYRPAFNSPTIDAGNNSGVAGTDLDERPRVVNGAADMGAYEYDAAFYDSNSDGIPDAWGIQYFGSATGGLASANGDADPFDNGNEYIAGTDPTNAASFFSITNTAVVAEGFMLEWEAVTGRVYSVSRRDSLTNSFQTLETSIAYPQSSYTDTNLTVAAQSFYQLGVQLADQATPES